MCAQGSGLVENQDTCMVTFMCGPFGLQAGIPKLHLAPQTLSSRPPGFESRIPAVPVGSLVSHKQDVIDYDYCWRLGSCLVASSKSA